MLVVLVIIVRCYLQGVQTPLYYVFIPAFQSDVPTCPVLTCESKPMEWNSAHSNYLRFFLLSLLRSMIVFYQTLDVTSIIHLTSQLLLFGISFSIEFLQLLIFVFQFILIQVISYRILHLDWLLRTPIATTCLKWFA